MIRGKTHVREVTADSSPSQVAAIFKCRPTTARRAVILAVHRHKPIGEAAYFAGISPNTARKYSRRFGLKFPRAKRVMVP